MIPLEEIQKRLAETIKQSGLTQTELANKLNVRQQTISKYIKGTVFPALDTFANLCEVIDADPAYILGLSKY